ncbi:hypothetical protein TorRG33x02_235670 [Trema orientale]|uniref:Uncharacterized protein n=1 Tax=Trema orientale TaxID=63057 RepID=A0A2P5E214_TREOI|nr:hypothetical protein TorRG33x02_235670 [Trema orientale]
MGIRPVWARAYLYRGRGPAHWTRPTALLLAHRDMPIQPNTALSIPLMPPPPALSLRYRPQGPVPPSDPEKDEDATDLGS